MSKCYLGDWFVLYQISKNVNFYFMRAFMKELRNELREKPKRSRSMERRKKKEADAVRILKNSIKKHC